MFPPPPPPYPHADPRNLQWYRCATANWAGKWCKGEYPPKTCWYCHEPCTFVHPILASGAQDGKKGGKSQGKGTKGKGKAGASVDHGQPEVPAEALPVLSPEEQLSIIVKSLIDKGHQQIADEVCHDAGYTLPAAAPEQQSENNDANTLETMLKYNKAKKHLEKTIGEKKNKIKRLGVDMLDAESKMVELQQRLEIVDENLTQLKKQHLLHPEVATYNANHKDQLLYNLNRRREDFKVTLTSNMPPQDPASYMAWAESVFNEVSDVLDEVVEQVDTILPSQSIESMDEDVDEDNFPDASTDDVFTSVQEAIESAEIGEEDKEEDKQAWIVHTNNRKERAKRREPEESTAMADDADVVEALKTRARLCPPVPKARAKAQSSVPVGASSAEAH